MSMSTSYTAYFNPGLRLYSDDVSSSRASDILPKQFKDLYEHICLSYLAEGLDMAIAETRSVEPMLIGAAADNARSFVVLRVVGEIKVTTVGNDSDDASAITGISQSYGTTLFPGFLVLSPYNLDSITVEAITASTVDIITGVFALSTDSRI